MAVVRSAQEPFNLAPALRALGATVLTYPCAEIVLHKITPPTSLDRYDWLLLPTFDAVLALDEAIRTGLLSPEQIAPLRLAAFGALARLAASAIKGLSVATPNADTHADLVQAMHLGPDSRVLLVQPATAKNDWSSLITTVGASVSVLPLYRVRLPRYGDPLPVELWSGTVDAILFGSESDVRYFAARLKHDGGVLAMLDHVCVACLDHPTATAASALGLRPSVIPADPTPEAFVSGVAAYLNRTLHAGR